MLEIEKIKDKIQQLSEAEAKSLLLIIYGRLDTAINGNCDENFVKETMDDLFEIYFEMPMNK
ncbi:hypothetical protein [Bacillus sp. JJ722]|uniref:hypothetical protein n=1 Tax=Bacillus sp. JJ722 TaxID=3122973 RepID=UPI002FFE8534